MSCCLRLETTDCDEPTTQASSAPVDYHREEKEWKVRHVRMLVLCLVTVFAMSATTLAVTSPALASGCNQECKELKEKEKQEKTEAKEKEKQEKEAAKEAEKAKRREEKFLKKHPEGEFEIFNDCPLVANTEYQPELSACIFGEAGPESFFQAGKVTVHFVKPILLRGGMIENEETGELKWVGARYGNTISKEAEPAPSLTEGVDAELFPEREKARYEEYVASGGSTNVTATIELAAPASDIELNEANLLSELGTSFGFPVEIHLSNKFLGNNCYVGSYTEPIDVPFTTGETSPEPPNVPIHGKLGKIEVKGEGEILHIEGTTLVNNTYAAPGVQGCGINGGADAGLNGGLGLPSPAGSNASELIGSLNQAGANRVTEHIHL
jgi:hypothetical protein